MGLGLPAGPVAPGQGLQASVSAAGSLRGGCRDPRRPSAAPAAGRFLVPLVLGFCLSVLCFRRGPAWSGPCVSLDRNVALHPQPRASETVPACCANCLRRTPFAKSHFFPGKGGGPGTDTGRVAGVQEECPHHPPSPSHCGSSRPGGGAPGRSLGPVLVTSEELWGRPRMPPDWCVPVWPHGDQGRGTDRGGVAP